jgi:1-phosphatidylinositol-4-phosphate 5-kinase
MHGVGTYTGNGGTTYKGQWSMNVKHGHGRKTYANGDVYAGFWKQGVQEGFAKYVWANGNEYQGEWRGGSMCGKGVLTWASGDRFDGQWLDGLEHGHGIYTWVDGSCYIGTWSRGLKDGKGVFYPAGSLSPGMSLLRNTDRAAPRDDSLWTSHQSHRLGDDGRELRAPQRSRSHSSSSEKFLHVGDLSMTGELSQQGSRRRWSMESPVERAPGLDATTPWTVETIREGVEKTGGRYEPDGVRPLPPTVVVREYVQGVLMSELVKENVESAGHKKRRTRKASKEIKRPGETIFKGHRSYDLMLNLQLGIRLCHVPFVLEKCFYAQAFEYVHEASRYIVVKL